MSQPNYCSEVEWILPQISREEIDAILVRKISVKWCGQGAHQRLAISLGSESLLDRVTQYYKANPALISYILLRAENLNDDALPQGMQSNLTGTDISIKLRSEFTGLQIQYVEKAIEFYEVIFQATLQKTSAFPVTALDTIRDYLETLSPSNNAVDQEINKLFDFQSELNNYIQSLTINNELMAGQRKHLETTLRSILYLSEKQAQTYTAQRFRMPAVAPKVSVDRN